MGCLPHLGPERANVGWEGQLCSWMHREEEPDLMKHECQLGRSCVVTKSQEVKSRKGAAGRIYNQSLKIERLGGGSPGILARLGEGWEDKLGAGEGNTPGL